VVTEMICSRCNATYPEGEPHACEPHASVPQPADSGWSEARWAFKLVTGIAGCLFGAFAARFWYDLAHRGYSHNPVGTAAAVVTILCLGSGLWIVIGAILERDRKG
jgi:hypothetical protein